ncbi:STAS/SEC14 domain-containing protein [uncultured Litoreibacter sp.]|uniref:STAS/SEC14 domain-containing protein n=1 Tax=uncultured Litoreibacter sp. TaxID=1392394 RepID=UPI0026350BA1|nr:STAS/SEC14 domain-containing protein [uncultured Litoreibacter sp.]
MFKVETMAPNLLKVEISGKITASQMSDGLDSLFPLTNKMSDGRLLAIYHDVEFPEAGAILEEMKRLPQLFGVIGKIGKVALVSNQKWIRDIAMLEGKLIPNMTIRSFEFKDRSKAEAYLDIGNDEEDDFENFPV